MTHLVDLDETSPTDLRELASARAMLEDLDAPRAPLPPVVVEDPETAAAWERLCQERSNRDSENRGKWLNEHDPEQLCVFVLGLCQAGIGVRNVVALAFDQADSLGLDHDDVVIAITAGVVLARGGDQPVDFR